MTILNVFVIFAWIPGTSLKTNPFRKHFNFGDQETIGRNQVSRRMRIMLQQRNCFRAKNCVKISPNERRRWNIRNHARFMTQA